MDKKSLGGNKDDVNSNQPPRLAFPARQLKHHYILTPIGKPQNATNDGKEHDSVTGKPLIVMPPGPVIVEEEQEEDQDEANDAEDAEVSDEVYDDHDSGEDKVAAMIAEMQAKAADGGDPTDEEKKGTEGNPDEQAKTTAQPTSDSVATEMPSEEDDNDVLPESSFEQEGTESEMDVDEGVGEDRPDEEVETIDKEASEQLATLEPVSGDNENVTTIDTMPTEENIEADNDVDVEDETSDQVFSDTSTTAEPGDEDNDETPGETHDDAKDNEADKENDVDTGEVEPEEDSPGQENATEDETVPSETPATPESEGTDIHTTPTAAPTAVSSEQKAVITASPSAAPSALTNGEVMPSAVENPDAIPASSNAESPVAAPSETHANTEKENHEDAPEPKNHEIQPHSDTSGPTDASSPSFGALCRHPSGLAQKFNCKVVVGVQSHPLAFSAAFFVLFVWGCCLCRRMCKGGSRRDERGEYREIAAQYDDVLFQDTFDDNYSASFGDDRSADGSIMSDEEDDWTKGPNIELSGMSRQKDDLTLEEMNG